MAQYRAAQHTFLGVGSQDLEMLRSTRMPSIRTTEMAGSLGETDGQVRSLPFADLFIGGGFVPHLERKQSCLELATYVVGLRQITLPPVPIAGPAMLHLPVSHRPITGTSFPVSDKNAWSWRDCEANSIPCHR